MKVAIIGAGHVGKAYYKEFKNSDVVVYDEPHKYLLSKNIEFTISDEPVSQGIEATLGFSRKEVNNCDTAIIAVPTDLNPETEELDMSIVEEVVDWLETDLIIIKSALQPGTADRLIEKTGKNIAVSVEYVGEGKYWIPPHKYPHVNDPKQHQMIVVGAHDSYMDEAFDVLWEYMSPDVQKVPVTPLEAEICKLVENAYGSLKVSWSRSLRTLCELNDVSFMRLHEAWKSDPRVDAMHTKAIGHHKGWNSKCWNKDVVALRTYAKKSGAKDLLMFVDTILKANGMHGGENKT